MRICPCCGGPWDETRNAIRSHIKRGFAEICNRLDCDPVAIAGKGRSKGLSSRRWAVIAALSVRGASIKEIAILVNKDTSAISFALRTMAQRNRSLNEALQTWSSIG